MFKLQISDIKQIFMILWIFFFLKIQKISQKSYVLCLYEKCTPEELQIIENRQKMQKILKSPTLILCHSKTMWKKNLKKFMSTHWIVTEQLRWLRKKNKFR